MPLKLTKSQTLAMTAALLILFTPPLLVTSAQAYDDDVDIVCFVDEDEDEWCVEVDELKTTCPSTDPDGVGEECAGLDDNQVFEPQPIRQYQMQGVGGKRGGNGHGGSAPPVGMLF